MWMTIRSIMAEVGDMTPVGIIEKWETEPELGLVILTINGQEYSRYFDVLMDVCREEK
jgi:hypothetical protein